MADSVVSLSARYPTRKVKKLGRLAERGNRSLAGEIRAALDHWIAIHEADEAHLKGERP